MTTTTIDGVRRPPLLLKASRCDTPIWVLQPTEDDGGIPVDVDGGPLIGDPLPAVRTSAHSVRMLGVVRAATESGEATRGRPPPVTVTFIAVAQAGLLATAVLNLWIW